MKICGAKKNFLEAEYMNWMKYKKSFIALGIVIAAVGSWQYVKSHGTEEPVTYVDQTYMAQKGDVRIDYAGDGDVELSTLNLDFEVSGTVDAIQIEEGSYLEEGAIVASLDPSDYQTSYEKAKSAYSQALLNYDATLAQVKLNSLSRNEALANYKLELDNAKVEYDRNVQLEGVISTQEMETSRLAYEKALNAYNTQKAVNAVNDTETKDVELAQNAIETAELNLREAEADLEDTELVSPVSGKVLAINFSKGEAFTSPNDNSSSTSHFVVLLNSDDVEVISPISEIDIESVYVGQVVEIVFEAYPQKTYHGIVKRVEDIPTSESGLVTYDAILQMTDADDSVKDGMTCEIDFILSQRQNVIVIPNKAVEFVDGTQYVTVLNEDGSKEERAIQTGLTDGKNVEVTEGISEHETVVYQIMSQE